MRTLRTVLVAVLITVSSLALGCYVVVHWAERQILTTDNWVALVSPLPKESVVSKALGSYMSEQIYSSGQVEAKVVDALPPKAAFLAGPLTDQLQKLTTNVSERVVASDAFQTIWEGANRAAMNRLLSKARGQETPLQQNLHERFNLDLSSAGGQIKDRLGSAAEALPALQAASKKDIGVSTDLQARAERVRQAVRTTDMLAVLLPFVAVTAFVGALAFSRHRRRTTLVFVFAVIALMLVELVTLKVLRQQVLDQVHNTANLLAVGYLYDTLVGWLHRMLYVVIVVSGVLAVLLWLGGSSAWAEKTRAFIRLDHLRQTSAIRTWRNARVWSQKYEYYGWLIAFFLVLITLALLGHVTTLSIVNAVLVLLGLFALLHIFATPPYAKGAA